MRILLLVFLWTAFVFDHFSNPLQYQLVFSDEFDHDHYIDRSKWNVVDRPSEVNGELQWYSYEDAYTAFGFLFLRSRKRYVSGWGTSRQYSSGKVDTKGKFELLYGEVEWRVQLPRGRGIWPALWLLHFACPAATPCSTWPPEIDVMEARGDRPNRISQTVHYGRWPNNDHDSQDVNGPDFTADFHTFKVIWDPNQIVWLVDGVQKYRITDGNKIPHEKMYLIMNVAVGGSYAGSPDRSTRFPTNMIIDYVRVWRWQ